MVYDLHISLTEEDYDKLEQLLSYYRKKSRRLYKTEVIQMALRYLYSKRIKQNGEDRDSEKD